MVDQDPITVSNQASVSFTFSGAEVGSTYAYTFSSNGGGTDVTGGGTISTATDQITGIDLSGLGDGTVTLSVTLASGNGTGSAATDSSTKATSAPSGYSVVVDQDPITVSNQASVSFTFSGAEVGSTYAYTFSSNGGGTDVTGGGTISTATDQITGIDLSGLGDGTVTLSVTLANGNGTGSAATDSSTKATSAPSGYSVVVDQDPITVSNQASVSFTFSGAEVGSTYAYTFSSNGGGTDVTGGGTISTATDQITGIDLSGLGDGTVTLSVTLANGNGTGSAATDSSTKATSAPSGYSVVVDQDPITVSNQASVSFTFSGAEVGSTYAYTFSSNGGGTDVTGGGTISTATDQITGIDLSGLGDGTVTLSVTLANGNGTGSAATDSSTKATSAPSGYSVVVDQDPITVSNQASVSFTFSGAEVGSTYAYTFSSNGGGTDVTGGGTISTATDQITGIDLSGLGDGTVTLSVTLANGNGTGSAATDSSTKATSAPSGYSVVVDQDPITVSNQASVSFTFSGAEVGSTYAYTFSSNGGGTDVTGGGTISTATDQITGIDLSGLGDGTVTLSVTLANGNGTGSAATDSSTKATSAPSGYSVVVDQDPITVSNQASVSFTFSGAEVGSTYAYTFSSNGGGTDVTGGGTISTATDQITGIDLSGLGDGTVTLSVTLANGNGTGSAATDSSTKATSAPSGYSVVVDQDPITVSNQASVSFTFSGAEVGSTYAYTFSSNGGGTDVTGGGTISTATDQITGIDLSGLGDGTVTLSVTLANGNGTGSAATDNSTKQIDSISINDVSQAEGNSSTSTFVFTVSVDGGGNAASDIGFTVNTSDNGATAGTDYVAIVNGNGTITTGSSSTTVVVTVNGDTTVEGDEGFTVTISNPVNATISGPTGVGTITNDDSAGVSMSTTSINTNEDAGSETFTISLTSQPTADVVVSLVSTDTEEGTVDPTVTITPANWNTGVPVTVTIVDDGIVDGNDTFSIQTTEVSSTDPNYDALGGADVADVSITNADTDSASISISNATALEDSGTIQFVVTLVGDLPSSLTFDYATADGTGADPAVAGSDYNAVSTTAAIGPSAGTTNLSISLTTDAIIEADEIFTVTISNLSNPAVTITNGIATGTIQNDDVCSAGTQAPLFDTSEPTEFCDAFSVNLNDYTTSVTPSGSQLKWSLQNTSLNDEANHLVSNAVSTPGTYYGFFYDDVNDCLSPILEVTITASTTPFPGNPINTSVINDSSLGTTIVDLDNQLGDSPDSGVWTFVSGPIQLNPDSNNQVNFNNAPEADYVYQYTTNVAQSPCVDQSVTVTVSVTSCLVFSDVGSNAPILNPDQPTNFCDALSANLDDYVVGQAPAGTVLTWSTSSDPLQTSAHRSPNVIAPGTYYGFFFDDADATNNVDCASPVLEIALVLNDTPSITNSTGGTICGTGSVLLTVGASVGATINWYASATSTTVLATGTTYEPTVSETTSFFAEATANGCASERVEVVATILDEPFAGTPTNTLGCNEAGTGETTMLDLDNTLEGEDPGSWTLKSSPNDTNVTINDDGTVDFFGLPLGDYVFTYTTTGAQAPCTNQSVDVTITVIDCLLDADNDGLEDDEEVNIGTDPQDPDTDDDGIEDGQEVTDGTDPLDDCDSNGGTPLGDSDCDGDGLTNAEENDLGTDPNDADSDSDGLTDGEEVLVEDDPNTTLVPEEASDPLDPCDPFLTNDCNPDPIDLAVTKEVDTERPLIGDTITFTITLENSSMDRVIDVQVSEVLDLDGFQYVSHNATKGTYDVSTGVWDIEELIAEEMVVLELVVTVESAGTIVNTVELLSSVPVDSNTENNTATVTIIASESDCHSCGSICNLFSPNGDGTNDELILNCHETYPNSSLEIFDQYGNSVFEMVNYDSSWDGTGKNGALPKGTYFYILDLGDGSEVKKGWIQIIR